MIKHISINNFAVIKNADIDLYEGLNIITGETGAGKSIIIEAVSLAFGSRADTAFIRSGENKAIIQIAYEKDGQEFILTREISSNGRNLCRINGEIVTLAYLSEFCAEFADIHGQYDHQSLLDPENHIKLIDSYQNEYIIPALNAVSSAYECYDGIRKDISFLDAQEHENRRSLDFMRFEADEIEKASLTPGEDDELLERVDMLQNSEKIYNALAASYEAVSGESGALASNALEKLTQGLTMIRQISEHSQELKELEQRYSDIYYDLEALAFQIRNLRDKTTYNQEELDIAIGRLDLIESFKAKYGNSIEDILDYKDKLNEKLKYVEDASGMRSELEKRLSICENKLKKSSEHLSDLRRSAAKMLEDKIQHELDTLNFSNAHLKIAFSKKEHYTSNGTDNVEFMISTNKGEAMKPLAKIASGGETSRIMLAFKKIIGDYDDIPTMIFDEIDSGISGITASIVGRNLLELSRNHQIICITHLPQIAAFGKNNFKISKDSDDTETYTTIEHLDNEKKLHEIARLTGGMNITEKTLDNARELINESK